MWDEGIFVTMDIEGEKVALELIKGKFPLTGNLSIRAVGDPDDWSYPFSGDTFTNITVNARETLPQGFFLIDPECPPELIEALKLNCFFHTTGVSHGRYAEAYVDDMTRKFMRTEEEVADVVMDPCWRREPMRAAPEPEPEFDWLDATRDAINGSGRYVEEPYCESESHGSWFTRF